MREINHNTLRYSGQPGEQVVVRVEEQETTHLVTFTLDGGEPEALPQGESIVFNLKNQTDERTDLQLNLDFNAQGSYLVAVENVTNCSKDTDNLNECRRTRFGPPEVTLNFKFFVD